MLGEEYALLLPEVFDETDQRASERAERCGRRTLTLHISPVNLDTHVIVAPGIPCMSQAVASMRTSTVPFIPMSSTLLLLQILACILQQELLCVVGEGKYSIFFHSHQVP